MSTNTVCGRDYEVRHPIIIPKIKYKHKPHPRYLVQGVNHPKGLPIRFKSLQRAEHHIRNMGLALD